MRKFVAAVAGLAVIVLVGIGVIALVPGVASSQEGDPLAGIKTMGQNALIDISGVKDDVENALESHLDVVAQAVGLSEADCAQIVYALDIPNWQAIVLPSSANELASFSGTLAGIDGTVTFYDDPSYLSVDAFGQTFTLSIPETAQSYLVYLPFNLANAA